MKREIKRSKASSPSPEGAHASKRQKLSDDSDGQDSDSAGQWTKVEKRKSKKHKKMETKYDVRFAAALHGLILTLLFR